MKGIVIAAGLGSRMGRLTEHRPKCMLPLAGKSLLERTAMNLRAAGCDDVVVVVGHRAERIAVPGITTVLNRDYATNNILHSLFCAREHLEGPALISYSDIWVEPWIHERLVASEDDITLAVDVDWEPYYEGRVGHPVTQAENAFVAADAGVHAIGKHLRPGDEGELVCGEFLGLWAMSSAGTRRLVALFDDLDARLGPDEAFQNAEFWRNAYVTDLFQEWIDRGDRLGAAVIERGWAELDTAEDYLRLPSIARRQRLRTLCEAGEPITDAAGIAYLDALGSRLLGEANDLKRTPEALARELDVPLEWVQSVIAGAADVERAELLLELVTQQYPVAPDSLCVVRDDTDAGVLVMSAAASKSTRRVFDRRDGKGGASPYYEYRDTAMSRTTPFKPEWIRELRVVADDDPHNREVVYNRGHLLHQLTFFIGEVNFYWESEGKRQCAALSTGDSCYITPYVPHSFTSRNADAPGTIIAITYAASVRRALDDFEWLGAETANEFSGDLRDPDGARRVLLSRQLAAESLSPDDLALRLAESGISRDRCRSLLAGDEPETVERAALASALRVRAIDLEVPEIAPGGDVAIRRSSGAPVRNLIGVEGDGCRMRELVRFPGQPGLKGFDVEIFGAGGPVFRHSLAQYVFNYGSEPVELHWGEERAALLEPGASAALRPGVAHRFVGAAQREPVRLVVLRVPGRLDAEVLREFAGFARPGRERVAGETRRWF